MSIGPFRVSPSATPFAIALRVTLGNGRCIRSAFPQNVRIIRRIAAAGEQNHAQRYCAHASFHTQWDAPNAFDAKD